MKSAFGLEPQCGHLNTGTALSLSQLQIHPVCVCVISWFSGFADEVETTSLWHTLRFVEEEERYYRTLNRVTQIPQHCCRWGNVHSTWKTHLLLILGNPEYKTSGNFCPDSLHPFKLIWPAHWFLWLTGLNVPVKSSFSFIAVTHLGMCPTFILQSGIFETATEWGASAL